MKTLVLLLVLVSASTSLRADDISLTDRQTSAALVASLKAGDKAAVAKLMRYPVARMQPLASLKNANEFILHYNEFFDVKSIDEIEKGQKEIWSNWRGTSIGLGLVWISDGKIIALNVSTDVQESAAKAAKAAVVKELHPSAKKYDAVLFECSTDHHHIRIHRNKERIQYFSWKIRQPISEKPDLELSGEMDIQGSGGNTNFTFKNQAYTYEVYRIRLCGEDCDSKLIISKDGKQISSEICR